MSKIFEAIKLYVEAANDVLEAQQTLEAVREEAEQEHGNEFEDTIESLAMLLLNGLGKKVKVVPADAPEKPVERTTAPTQPTPQPVPVTPVVEPVSAPEEPVVVAPPATVEEHPVVTASKVDIPAPAKAAAAPQETVTPMDSFEADEDPFAEEPVTPVAKPAAKKAEAKKTTPIPTSADPFADFDDDTAPF